MRVLGIDPGLNITGYGVLEPVDDRLMVIEAGVIRTDERMGLAMRLREIASEIEAIISQHAPDAIAVEELYSHYAHPRTAIIISAVLSLGLFLFFWDGTMQDLDAKGVNAVVINTLILAALLLFNWPDFVN